MKHFSLRLPKVMLSRNECCSLCDVITPRISSSSCTLTVNCHVERRRVISRLQSQPPAVDGQICTRPLAVDGSSQLRGNGGTPVYRTCHGQSRPVHYRTLQIFFF